MVIIISVMPLFTYPNMSLHNNRVIIVLCELQIFSYLTNKGVTRVHCNRMPNTQTSCAMMSSIMILYCLEAFALEVASGVNSLRGKSPLP
jgi:hypothetical protein